MYAPSLDAEPPPSVVAVPPEGVEGAAVEAGLLADASLPESSLPPHAVSERVAASPTAARAAMRVYFSVFPQEWRRGPCGQNYG